MYVTCWERGALEDEDCVASRDYLLPAVLPHLFVWGAARVAATLQFEYMTPLVGWHTLYLESFGVGNLLRPVTLYVWSEEGVLLGQSSIFTNRILLAGFVPFAEVIADWGGADVA